MLGLGAPTILSLLATHLLSLGAIRIADLVADDPDESGVLFDEGDTLCIGADGGLVAACADGSATLVGSNTDEYLIKFFREVTSGKLEYTDPGWAEVGGA